MSPVTSTVTGVEDGSPLVSLRNRSCWGILLGAVVLAAIAVVIYKIITETLDTAPGRREGSTAVSTTPTTPDAADRTRRKGFAVALAAAGLAIAVALAGIFMPGPPLDALTGTADAAAAQPDRSRPRPNWCSLMLLSAPLDTLRTSPSPTKTVRTSACPQDRGKSVASSFNDDECEDLCTLLAL